MRTDEDDFGISVIVITYNEEANIRDCLDSLATVDFPEEKYELIVVDASDDSTPEIVKTYPGVRCLRSSKGYASQKNTGLRAAAYNIVAFTDADCIIPQNWLQATMEAFQDKRIVGVGGNALAPPGTNYFGLCAASVGHPGGGAIGFDANVKPGPEGIEFVAGCNSAFRKEAILAIGGYDEAFDDGGEDLDISRRLRAAGHYLHYAPSSTVYHKPRPRFLEYVRWNIGVGITKFNLKRPGLGRLVFQPSFPAWLGIFLVGIGHILALKPLFLIPILLGGWAIYLGVLYIGSRPYPLLLKRRRQIGIDLLSALTMVPFLIYVRQVCINLGQLKKWFKRKRAP